ncbi:MAG: pitrilysin family protein [Capsulimonadaceae bacterium]|nr:pitrilysin family protein [Capsulimonadaceae bacterium]
MAFRTFIHLRYVLAVGILASMCLTSHAETAAPRDVRLPCGIRLIVKEEQATSLVAVQVFVRAGSDEEDASNCGIGSFVAATLLKGTKNQHTQDISRLIGSLGDNVSTSWDPDFTQIQALTLASRFDDASYLISDVLKNATFPDDEVKTARASLLSGFQARSLDLYTPVYDNMRRVLYAGTSRERPMNGDQSVIEKLKPSDLRAFYQRTFVPRNIVIAVVGNVPADRVIASFRTNLANFPRANPSRNVPALSGPTPITKPITVKKFRGDINACYILAGYLAPGAGARDYPAMLVMNTLLGGMKTSKLFTSLREKQGLGYEVSSIFPPQVGWSDVSAFIVAAPTKDGPDGKPVEMTPIVRDALIEAIKEFHETKPADADLQRAKRFLIGSYLIAHERIERRAYFLGYSEIAQKELGGYEFDTNYADAINRVTVDDVQRAAKQYLGDGVVLSMILPGDPNAGVIHE